MKLRYILLFILGLCSSAGRLSAQAVAVGIADTNVYFPGHYLEIGINNIGAFGGLVPPAGYHPGPVGTPLAVTYDAGHDGWTVAAPGMPDYFGDYTYPGTPFEGWEIQINGTSRNQAFTVSGATSPIVNTGSGPMTGYSGGYTNSGGTISSVWKGQTGVGGVLKINQVTSMDTNGSVVYVTTTLHNTSAAAVPNVYYFRSCDGDNDETLTGNFETDNTILHQNEDASHRVEADEAGTVYHNHWSICAKDCRAKALIYEGWPLSISTNLANVWAGTAGLTAQYTLGGTLDGDNAEAIVFKIGNIAAGATAVVSYAYVFTDSFSSIDIAFPDPQLMVDGIAVDSVDTFNTCAYTGLLSVPVNIANASTGAWTFSNWTWAPTIGLASDTGVNNSVNIAALSVPVTYTITGTDSAMGSCAMKTFYLTVIPCFNVSNNGPICQGDNLDLFSHGDSTGATYSWYNAAGTLVSTAENPVITNAQLADSGVYMAIESLGSGSDTAYTDVVIKPLPILNLTSNAPICSGTILNLAVSPDSTGETFSWSGPNGFTSAVENPTINPASTLDQGIFAVLATFNGCINSASIAVAIDSTPLPIVATVNTPICDSSNLYFTALSGTQGATYFWTSTTGFTSASQNPEIEFAPVSASGVYSVSATLSGDCPTSAFVIAEVDTIPVLLSIGSDAPVCTGGSVGLNVLFSGMGAGSYSWHGPLGFISDVQNPTVNNVSTLAAGTYFVNETLAGCTSDTASIFVEVDSTPETPAAFNNTTICQGDTLRLSATDATAGVVYSWTGPDSFASDAQNPIIPNAPVAANGTYAVTAILISGSFSCSATTTTNAIITPMPSYVPTSNSPVCTGDTLQLHANAPVGSAYTWTGPYYYYASSSASDPTINNVSVENAGVYTVTTLYQTCITVETDTVVINTTPLPPFIAWLTYCQNYPASPLLATGSNIQWYLADSVQSGVISDPVPQTSVVGATFYFTTQTVNGCISAIDSVQVTVNPTPVVTVTPTDTAVCPHTPVLLTALDTDAIAYYHWYPGTYLSDTNSAAVTANPEGNMTYNVIASNQFGCADTISTHITVFPAAVISLPDSVTLYPGDSYTMNPITNCSYFSWFPPTGLSNSYISNPVVTPEQELSIQCKDKPPMDVPLLILLASS